MRRFRESLILKVIALALVITFASQQVAFAEKVDLREEGEIGALDVVLALVSGILLGLGVNPAWSAIQSFAMVYLVPRGASLLCDAAGIKNPYLRAAIEVGISYGAGAAIDTSAASKAAKTGATVAQAGRWASVGTRIKNFFKGLTGAAKAAQAGSKLTEAGGRALAGQSASLFTVALIKGAQGAIYGVARTYLYENIKKYDKRLAIFVSEVGGAVVSQFAELALSKAFGVAFGYDKYGRYAIKPKGGTPALNRFLNIQLLRFLTKELPAHLVAGGVEVALAEAGMSEEGVRGIGGMVSSIVSSLLARGGKFVKDYEGKNLSELKEARDKLQAEINADRAATEKGDRNGMLGLNELEEKNARLQTIDALMTLRIYQGNLAVYTSLDAEYASEYIRLRYSLSTPGEPFSLEDLALYEDLCAYLGENAPGALNPGSQTGLPLIGGAASGEKSEAAEGQDADKIKLYRSLIRDQQAEIRQAKGGFLSILIDAAIAGAVSAGLQYISSKTPSALHGAVLNLFASSVIKALLIKSANLFRRTEDGDIVAASKDLSFYAATIGASATAAVADVISMGRAGARLNGNGTFDLDWNNTNDSLVFLPRLYSYIQDMDKYGMITALMNQFISSIHYQATKNVSDTITGRIQHTYLLAVERPKLMHVAPALRQKESDSPLAELARKADLARPVGDLPVGTKVYRLEYDVLGNGVELTGIVKENKDGIVTVQWDGGAGEEKISGNQTIGEVFAGADFKWSYAKLARLRSNYNPLRSPFSGIEQAVDQLTLKREEGTINPQEEKLLSALETALEPYRRAVQAWGAPGHRGLWTQMEQYFNPADLSNPLLQSLPAIQAAREEKLQELIAQLLKNQKEKAALRSELYAAKKAALALATEKLIQAAEAANPDECAKLKKEYAEAMENMTYFREGLRQKYGGESLLTEQLAAEEIQRIEQARIDAYCKAAPGAARSAYDKALKEFEQGGLPQQIAAAHQQRAENKAIAQMKNLYLRSLSVVHDLTGTSLKYLSSWANKPAEPPAAPAPAVKVVSEPPKEEPKSRIEEIEYPPPTEESRAPELEKLPPQPPPLPAVPPEKKPAESVGKTKELPAPITLPEKKNDGTPVVLVNPQTLEPITVGDMDLMGPKSVPKDKIGILVGRGRVWVDADLFPQAPANPALAGSSAGSPTVGTKAPVAAASVAKEGDGVVMNPDGTITFRPPEATPPSLTHEPFLINPKSGQTPALSGPVAKARDPAGADDVSIERDPVTGEITLKSKFLEGQKAKDKKPVPPPVIDFPQPVIPVPAMDRLAQQKPVGPSTDTLALSGSPLRTHYGAAVPSGQDNSAAPAPGSLSTPPAPDSSRPQVSESPRPLVVSHALAPQPGPGDVAPARQASIPPAVTTSPSAQDSSPAVRPPAPAPGVSPAPQPAAELPRAETPLTLPATPTPMPTNQPSVFERLHRTGYKPLPTPAGESSSLTPVVAVPDFGPGLPVVTGPAAPTPPAAAAAPAMPKASKPPEAAVTLPPATAPISAETPKPVTPPAAAGAPAPSPVSQSPTAEFYGPPLPPKTAPSSPAAKPAPSAEPITLANQPSSQQPIIINPQNNQAITEKSFAPPSGVDVGLLYPVNVPKSVLEQTPAQPAAKEATSQSGPVWDFTLEPSFQAPSASASPRKVISRGSNSEDNLPAVTVQLDPNNGTIELDDGGNIARLKEDSHKLFGPATKPAVKPSGNVIEFPAFNQPAPTTPVPAPPTSAPAPGSPDFVGPLAPPRPAPVTSPGQTSQGAKDTPAIPKTAPSPGTDNFVGPVAPKAAEFYGPPLPPPVVPSAAAPEQSSVSAIQRPPATAPKVPDNITEAWDSLGTADKEPQYNHSRRPDGLLDYTKLKNAPLENLVEAIKMFKDPSKLTPEQQDDVRNILAYAFGEESNPETLREYIDGVNNEWAKRKIEATVPLQSQGAIAPANLSISGNNTNSWPGPILSDEMAHLQQNLETSSLRRKELTNELNSLNEIIKQKISKLKEMKDDHRVDPREIDRMAGEIDGLIGQMDMLTQQLQQSSVSDHDKIYSGLEKRGGIEPKSALPIPVAAEKASQLPLPIPQEVFMKKDSTNTPTSQVPTSGVKGSEKKDGEFTTVIDPEFERLINSGTSNLFNRVTGYINKMNKKAFNVVFPGHEPDLEEFKPDTKVDVISAYTSDYFTWEGPVLTMHGYTNPKDGQVYSAKYEKPISQILKKYKDQGIKRLLVMSCNPEDGNVRVPEGMEVVFARSIIIDHRTTLEIMHGNEDPRSSKETAKFNLLPPADQKLIQEYRKAIAALFGWCTRDAFSFSRREAWASGWKSKGPSGKKEDPPRQPLQQIPIKK